MYVALSCASHEPLLVIVRAPARLQWVLIWDEPESP